MLHWFSSSIIPMSWLRYSSPLLCKRKPHSMPLVLTHTSLLASLPLASNPDITWSLLITSAGGNDVDPVERKQQIGLCLASKIGVQSTRTSAHTHAHGENYPPMLSKLGLWKHTLLIREIRNKSLSLLWEIMSFWAKNKSVGWKLVE